MEQYPIQKYTIDKMFDLLKELNKLPDREKDIGQTTQFVSKSCMLKDSSGLKIVKFKEENQGKQDELCMDVPVLQHIEDEEVVQVQVQGEEEVVQVQEEQGEQGEQGEEEVVQVQEEQGEEEVVQEEEDVEEQVEEEVEEEVVQEEDVEEEVVQGEDVEEQEEEVELVEMEIDGEIYYATGEENGDLFKANEDGEIGDEKVGVIVNGEVEFL